MQQQKNIPLLRFPGFEGEWEKKKLGDVAEVKRGAASQHLNYVSSSKHGIRLLRINDFLSDDAVYVEDTADMKKYRVKTDDLLIAGTGATAGITFMIPEKFSGLAYSYNAPRIRVEKADSFFVYQYLKSDIVLKQQNQLFVGNAQPFLDTDAMRGLKINLPSLPEQQKIASFFTAIDKKIAQLKQQKEKLELYKKGVMQQLFSQQLRFKTDEGNDFPEWEKKNGNEIFENVSDKNHNSDLPILAITQEHGAIPRDMIEYQISVTDKSVESYKVVDVGDYIISLRSFQGGIEYSNYKGICSPAYIILRPTRPLNRIFFKYYFKAPSYIAELNKKLEGIRDGKMISYKYFSEVKLPYPSLSEQTKIAQFLSALDEKINRVQVQTDKMVEWKKGLLQQMFV